MRIRSTSGRAPAWIFIERRTLLVAFEYAFELLAIWLAAVEITLSWVMGAVAFSEKTLARMVPEKALPAWRPPEVVAVRGSFGERRVKRNSCVPRLVVRPCATTFPLASRSVTFAPFSGACGPT